MIFNLTQPLISFVPVLGKDFTWSGSDGTCLVIDDGGGNWRIKFLSSGTFTPLKAMTIDAFLVGGGGGGQSPGGGGGYTTTAKSIALTANVDYTITVGAGGAAGAIFTPGTDGGNSEAFGYSAAGGQRANSNTQGGNGGSGGGSSVQGHGSNGGSDGGNGSGKTPGIGQGTTTREFGESTGDLYSGGGGGKAEGLGGAGGGGNYNEDGEANTGGGGGGSGSGGSGIVIIRKHKETAA